MSFFSQLKSARLKVLKTLAVVSLLALWLSAEPLKVAYSDWPGWVAWEVAL